MIRNTFGGYSCKRIEKVSIKGFAAVQRFVEDTERIRKYEDHTFVPGLSLS